MRKKSISLLIMLTVILSLIAAMSITGFADTEAISFDTLIDETINPNTGIDSFKYHVDKDTRILVYVESKGEGLQFSVQTNEDADLENAFKVPAGGNYYNSYTIAPPGDFYVSVIGNADTQPGYYMFVTEEPAKATLSSVKGGKKSLTAKWKAVKGASEYKVSYRLGSGKWKTKKTTKTSLKISGLKKGKKYSVKVQAVKVVNNIPLPGLASKTKSVKVK